MPQWVMARLVRAATPRAYRSCLFVSVAGLAQLLNTVRRAELRQHFKDSAGNIAGQDYQRFTSVLLVREEKRGGSRSAASSSNACGRPKPCSPSR